MADRLKQLLLVPGLIVGTGEVKDLAAVHLRAFQRLAAWDSFVLRHSTGSFQSPIGRVPVMRGLRSSAKNASSVGVSQSGPLLMVTITQTRMMITTMVFPRRSSRCTVREGKVFSFARDRCERPDGGRAAVLLLPVVCFLIISECAHHMARASLALASSVPCESSTP